MIRCFHQGDKNLVAAAMAVERVGHYSNGILAQILPGGLGFVLRRS
jgi:hypothetical protein